MDAISFRNHLTKQIIPFWNKMEDLDNGGFYGFADENGIPDKTYLKGCILNSRILWFYSASYNLLKDEGLLNKAKHAFDFLKNNFYDNVNSGLYWSLSADAKPLDTTKHTYNQAFAIYGLSEYYKASKDKEALLLAYSLYDTIENKCRDKDGYFEAFTIDFKPESNEKLSENGVMAERTMNTLLHVLEAYSVLYEADRNEKIGKSIREVLNIFKEKIYNPDKKICEVFFDKNYNSLIDLESYGHDIEASWLIYRALEVLDDKKYYDIMLPVVEGLAEASYINGIDKANNAMFNECEKKVISRKKVWWVQAESVTGFYNAYTLTNNEDYLNMSSKVWDYIQKYIIDKNTGEWIEDIQEDNTVTKGQALAHEWKCPYHNGRMCIEMIKRLSK